MKDIRKWLRSLGLCLGALLVVFASLASANTEQVQQWRFKVYLDDSEIGYHNFTMINAGGVREIQTEADFKVRFLRIPVYKYRHSNTERWVGNCLEAVKSTTNANGDQYFVAGSAGEQDFVVSSVRESEQDKSTLSGCIMTFAYWNPEFLQQSQLLNTQTGEYLDVTAQLIGYDELTVRGEPVPAYRYRLTSEELSIDLWYSMDEEWLALETLAEGGRRLRYELV